MLKIIIVFFSLISILYFFYLSISNHTQPHGNDLTSLINSSRVFYQDENPYNAGPRQYTYLLFPAMAAYPLTLLQSGLFPKVAAASLWSLLSALAFFMSIIMSWRFVDRIKSGMAVMRRNLFPIALLILILYPFLWEEFQHGQTNLITLGCIGGFFGMLRKDRQLWAALLLSFASSISIGPALCILYVFFTRQYRAAMAFIPLIFLFNIGYPYLVNPQSLDYYRYFFSEVIPVLAKDHAAAGFKSFSIISALGHLFSINWTVSLKLMCIALCSIALIIPPALIAATHLLKARRIFIYTFFATLVCIIPLAFPMTEPHNLLIMTIPFIAILFFWRDSIASKTGFWRDGRSLLLLVCVIALLAGYAWPQIPLSLPALLGIYVGLNMVLSKTKSRFAAD